MEKRVASIPLMLQALLLVAGLSAAAVATGSGDPGVIRLPSDAALGQMAVVRGQPTPQEGINGERRPWKCCDKAVTGPTTDGKVVWYCMDKVKKCTCDRCFNLEGSQLYYCLDGYQGSDPGPRCTHA